MATGLVIEVTRPENEVLRSARVDVLRGEDLRSRYDRLTRLVLRMGTWLSGPEAALLPQEEWERQFREYRRHLEELRTAGDELRPVTLRGRHELLSGDALADEVRELFAA